MPNSARVEQSRTIPVTPEQAFRAIIEMDVPAMFRRRYGPIPPIVRVGGRDGLHWTGTVGQTRVLELGGGGSIRETVVRVDEPQSWTYCITDFSGPLAALLTKIDGEFLCAPASTGTRITWRYNMFPCSGLAASALPAFGWLLAGLRASDAGGTLELARRLTVGTALNYTCVVSPAIREEYVIHILNDRVYPFVIILNPLL